MRVLYVEDNPANVFLVKRVARMGNHEIINLIDGQQALRKFDDIQPDIVLMDIQLSGEIGGLDVVRKLRERGVTTPIIAVTAYAMVGDKERCLEAGCDEYMAKPLPVPRLVELFEEHGKKAEAASAKAASAKAAPAKAASKEADEAASDTPDTEKISSTETDTAAGASDADTPAHTDTTAADDDSVSSSDTTGAPADEDTAQTPPPAVETDSVVSAPDGSATPAETDDEAPVSEKTDSPSDSNEAETATETDDTPTVTESTGQPDVQSGN